MPAFKVASGDLRNIPLLKHIAAVQKPMIVAQEELRLDDVRRAYDAVMHSISTFVSYNVRHRIQQTLLKWISRLLRPTGNEFADVVIGLSAHDNGIAMAVAAYVLGTQLIEKHFTLNRAMKGTDHAFSLEPVGLRKLVRDLKRTRVALGTGEKTCYPSEQVPVQKMGKKLVAARICLRDIAWTPRT